MHVLYLKYSWPRF